LLFWLESNKNTKIKRKNLQSFQSGNLAGDACTREESLHNPSYSKTKIKITLYFYLLPNLYFIIQKLQNKNK